jgi:hypothetical protein
MARGAKLYARRADPLWPGYSPMWNADVSGPANA